MNHEIVMSADAGYLALIDRLTRVRPRVFVFGGYAEDACSPAGQLGLTRSRVLVGRADLAEHLQRFAEWGFPSFEIYFEVVPGSPLVYHAASDRIELELGVYESWCLDGRRSSCPRATELTRVTLPSDSFTHPLGRIDGISIRTISPLALYQMRAAIMRTGVFGAPRPKDEAAQAQLRASLLAGMQTDELEPEFGPYPP